MNKIVAIVGMCGSGKSIASEYYEARGYKKVYFGGVVLEEVKKLGLDITPENEKYVRIAKISSAKTLKYTDKGLTRTQAYYYKIRAYKKIDGETVYGSFSKIYSKPKAGWRYVKIDGKTYKCYYNAAGEKVKDVSNIIGKQSSYLIKVNKRSFFRLVYRSLMSWPWSIERYRRNHTRIRLYDVAIHFDCKMATFFRILGNWVSFQHIKKLLILHLYSQQIY